MQSIQGGIKYLKKLYDAFNDIEDKDDRMVISLAAYNVGKSHVLDAQQIAREKGLNPNRWSSLKKTLPLLREEKYYKKTKGVYCRGSEPVRYI